MVNSEFLTIEEFNEIVNNGKVSIFDFSATWCGPCRMMAPVFEEFAEKHTDYLFHKIDIDENEDLSREFKIMYVPTFLVFKDGKELGRTSGYLPIEDFEKFVNDSLAKN